MTDYVLPKPPAMRGYALHRIAEGLTDGARPLFTDFGDHMVVRTAQLLQAPERAVRETALGDILGFELRACVGTKVKGKHRYFHGERHGFELITIHCTATVANITKSERRFTVDQTDFTGVLKVTDDALFRAALSNGIGSTARAFGFGFGMIHL